MPATCESLLAAANVVVRKVTAADAARLVEQRGGVLVDVRDGTEAAASGRAALAGKTLREMGYSDVHNLGGLAALMVLGGNVFGLLAPIVTGYIVAATGSFSSVFMLAGALSLIGAAVSFTLTRHTLGEETPVSVARLAPAGE